MQITDSKARGFSLGPWLSQGGKIIETTFKNFYVLYITSIYLYLY